MDTETAKLIAQQLRKPHGENSANIAEKMSSGNAYIYKKTIEIIDPQPGDHILEVGMANGCLVKDIAKNDVKIRYFGCDFSEEMVEQAKNLNKHLIEKGQAGFYFAPADKLPFSKGTFHKAFAVNVIYFWEEPSKELNELKRVLKKKGKLILALRPESAMRNYPFTRYGFKMYSRENLINLLEMINFKILNVKQFHEPDLELNGKFIKVDSLIVEAEKI
jgi:ubiquinone/menaquinone biosynthesis C-methylase UbiE